MQQLEASNHALGDPEALDRILKEKGYWFFRNVLDEDAVTALQNEYESVLRDHDLIDADSTDYIWNGNSTEAIGDGLNVMLFPQLRERRVWQNFVAHPAVNAFIEELLGGPLDWLTSSDFYRMVAPTQELPEDPYQGRHQDGHGLPGVDFMTCWIPLNDIDADVGGVTLCLGTHKHGIFHGNWFNPDYAPEAAWARADYSRGDILMFVPTTMHSGLANRSDRFRLSLDIRVVRPRSAPPIYGTITAIDSSGYSIRDDRTGESFTLEFTETSHLRGRKPGRGEIPAIVGPDEIAKLLPAGSKVMATRDGRRAVLLRPNEYPPDKR